MNEKNTAKTTEPIWDSRNSDEPQNEGLSFKDINAKKNVDAKKGAQRLEILFSGMNEESIGIVRKSRLFEICEKSLV